MKIADVVAAGGLRSPLHRMLSGSVDFVRCTDDVRGAATIGPSATPPVPARYGSTHFG